MKHPLVLEEELDTVASFCRGERLGGEITSFAFPAGLEEGFDARVRRHAAAVEGLEPVTFHGPFINLYVTSPDPAIVQVCEHRHHAALSAFATVAEAREAGLYARGWAPDVLPEDAGPLEEVHDLDTNARCLTAAVPPDSLASVRSALAQAGFAHRALGADHQPESFCLFSADDLAGGQLLYRKRDGGGVEYAAVREPGAFYYWSAEEASR